MHHALTSRKEKSEEQEKVFSEKFQRRFADMAKREHEDHLKHFQVGKSSEVVPNTQGLHGDSYIKYDHLVFHGWHH